jgi:hypothetical protein
MNRQNGGNDRRRHYFLECIAVSFLMILLKVVSDTFMLYRPTVLKHNDSRQVDR